MIMLVVLANDCRTTPRNMFVKRIRREARGLGRMSAREKLSSVESHSGNRTVEVGSSFY